MFTHVPSHSFESYEVSFRLREFKITVVEAKDSELNGRFRDMPVLYRTSDRYALDARVSF